VKLLKQKPEKFVINLKNRLLHLSLDYEIKSTHKGIDTVKMYFNLERCMTPQEVGKYFVRGLLKTLIEKTENQPTLAPSDSMDVTSLLNSNDINDLRKMIGVETVKAEEATKEQREVKKTAAAEDESNKASSKRALKRPVVEKDFKYNNNDSQEFALEPQQGTTSTTSKSKRVIKSKIPLKSTKKIDVKF
jgi:hypothetical protein